MNTMPQQQNMIRYSQGRTRSEMKEERGEMAMLNRYRMRQQRLEMQRRARSKKK